jgi:hypothetical protein|nr:MAG TPA: hypothetical protein [Caudoviricetes sp.]
MEYIVYRRFKSEGIDGTFNLRYGTLVTERDGFLFAADGRKICAATSENGWEHFRPDTPEGAYRQEMLTALYCWYDKNGCSDDFDDEKWPNVGNGYWKNRLRTASTERLRQIYFEKFGVIPCMQ